MDVELKPCPFCGGDAKIGQVPIFGGHPDAGGFYVQCMSENCHGCMGLRFACGEDPRPELVAAWNRRDEAHTRAAVEAERAACLSLIDKLMAQSHKVMRQTSTDGDLHKAAYTEALAFSCAYAAIAARKAQP